jgi:hypothetical protein
MSSNSRTRRTQPPRRTAPRALAPRQALPATTRREVETVPELDDYDDTYADDEPAEPDRAQEIEALGHYVTADLCGEQVRIVPPGAWRQSWQEHLHAGRINQFASYVIHPADLDLYDELDPTNDEFGEFVGEAAERAGESLGKSRGPAASSRRTRRR